MRTALVAIATAMLTFATSAHAQADAGEGPAVAPKPVNPGAADAPSELIRESGLPGAEDGGVIEADAGVPLAAAPTPAAPPTDWAISVNLAGSVRASYQGASPFPVDSELRRFTVAPLMTRVRVAPEFHLGGLGLFTEADVASGAILGIPSRSLTDPCGVGQNTCQRVPFPPITALELRKLYFEYKWASGAFRVGQQTSDWGLGLLANAGAKDPEAGDFGQQQFGSLVYRALIAVRPFFNLGGRWRAVETAFAADLVVRDSSGEFSRGDRAWQGVLALRFVKDEGNQFGVYAVYRNQRNIYVTDGGKATDVAVIDAMAKWELYKRTNRAFTLGAEAVTVQGTTTQARNENAPRSRVSQFGAAVKAAYRTHNTTFLLDGGFATGDQNPSDDRVENFRFDRDFKVGLVLFDHVLAYQTARASVRASDPNLVGVPQEGADLLGTGGAVTGAWYLFPRVKVGLFDFLDVYGGPLFAFTTAKLTDPYNTRLGGGTSLNFLNASPGGYLGTELDLGLQLRVRPVPELLLSATLEGGLFIAGDAFRLPQGGVMGPVGFGRVRLGAAL